MNIVNAKAVILSPDMDNPNVAKELYKKLELAGRTCYKSEDKITDESAAAFVKNCIERGHEAMIEHASMTVKFIVDRGVSHELVRHRLASFAQESTRYCNYSKDKFGNEITVIEPIFFKDIPEDRRREINMAVSGKPVVMKGKLTDHELAYFHWNTGCSESENEYFGMLSYGATPQEARSVLPNSLKTEVIMTANMREWRHFFKLRAAGITGKPHPQMLEVAVPLLNWCREVFPELFGDIQPME